MSNQRIVQTRLSTVGTAVRRYTHMCDTFHENMNKYHKIDQIIIVENTQPLVGIAAPWDIGSPSYGSSLGPFVFKRTSRLSNKLLMETCLPQFIVKAGHLSTRSHVNSCLRNYCLKLAYEVSDVVRCNKKFAVIGGDHSCAVGTWNGVANAMCKESPFGLIWIDAHLDAHTPESSKTGNLHGMPLAILLGHGNPKLTTLLSKNPVLAPENVVVIGIRSKENEELELLQGLGVRLYFMPEINRRGLYTILKEAKEIVTTNSKYFGISIDLDAIDPSQTPGVNTPEKAGLDVRKLQDALSLMSKNKKEFKRFLGIEIAEFNPLNDHHNRTVQVMDGLLESLLPEIQTYCALDTAQHTKQSTTTP